MKIIEIIITNENNRNYYNKCIEQLPSKCLLTYIKVDIKLRDIGNSIYFYSSTTSVALNCSTTYAARRFV